MPVAVMHRHLQTNLSLGLPFIAIPDNVFFTITPLLTESSSLLGVKRHAPA